MRRELRIGAGHREAQPRLQIGRCLKQGARPDLVDQVAALDVLEDTVGREQQRVAGGHRDRCADLDAHVAGADAVREQMALVVVMGLGGLEHSGCDTISDRGVRDGLEAHPPALADEQRPRIPGVIGAGGPAADLDDDEGRRRPDPHLEQLRIRVLEGVEDRGSQRTAGFTGRPSHCHRTRLAAGLRLGCPVCDPIRVRDRPFDRAPDRFDRGRRRHGSGRQAADAVRDREHGHRPRQLAEERRILVARRFVVGLRAEEHGLPPLGRETLRALVIELEEDLGHGRGMARPSSEVGLEGPRSAVRGRGATMPVRSGANPIPRGPTVGAHEDARE